VPATTPSAPGSRYVYTHTIIDTIIHHILHILTTPIYYTYIHTTQFGVQIVGIICIVAWTAVWSAILFYGIKYTIGLRVSDEVEEAGLDRYVPQ
jgi:ammonia channel protein AmtB